MTQTILLNESTQEDVTKSVSSFINWDGIMPEIERLNRVRSDEVITALIISDEGIEAKIGRKRGRKVKQASGE